MTSESTVTTHIKKESTRLTILVSEKKTVASFLLIPHGYMEILQCRQNNMQILSSTNITNSRYSILERSVGLELPKCMAVEGQCVLTCIFPNFPVQAHQFLMKYLHPRVMYHDPSGVCVKKAKYERGQ